MEEACAHVGVSRSTVARWAARGRAPGAAQDPASFAARLDGILEGRDGHLPSVDDVLLMLARAARKGSVTAMRELLAELRRSESVQPRKAEEDPFLAL
jgi:hypothetical protein